MATRAQQFHADEQRHASAKSKKKKKKDSRVKAAKGTNENSRTAKKATVALEAPAEGSISKKRSRKSTRKSANRSKPDTNLELRAQRKTNSADARARRGK